MQRWLKESLLSLLPCSGNLADDSEIDFYDVSQALVGFDRSLALTTHLILNGEIITQAPSLTGAHIYIGAPEEGSWKVKATIAALAAGVYSFGTVPKDTPLGHLISSAYDYVISESLGFHIDYDKTLGEQLDELRTSEGEEIFLPQSKFDSLIEKCEPAVRAMHRPMVASETANQANIVASLGKRETPIGPPLDRRTYEYLAYSLESERPTEYLVQVSSYNVNTFKGRIFVTNEHRPIPFELSQGARNASSIRSVAASLSENAEEPQLKEPNIAFLAFSYTSRTGRMKRLVVTKVRRVTSTD